jgi:hypothetical protein
VRAKKRGHRAIHIEERSFVAVGHVHARHPAEGAGEAEMLAVDDLPVRGTGPGEEDGRGEPVAQGIRVGDAVQVDLTHGGDQVPSLEALVEGPERQHPGNCNVITTHIGKQRLCSANIP